MVRAIYVSGAEQSVLRDPDCRKGESLTDVSFPIRPKGEVKKLDQILKKKRRAGVTFEGIFYGPEQVKIDPKLPEWLKKKYENATKRYGHQNTLETMIEVTKVIAVTDVDPSVPW